MGEAKVKLPLGWSPLRQYKKILGAFRCFLRVSALHTSNMLQNELQNQQECFFFSLFVMRWLTVLKVYCCHLLDWSFIEIKSGASSNVLGLVTVHGDRSHCILKACGRLGHHISVMKDNFSLPEASPGYPISMVGETLYTHRWHSVVFSINMLKMMPTVSCFVIYYNADI